MAQADDEHTTTSNVITFPGRARPLRRAPQTIIVDADAFRELEATLAAIVSLARAARAMGVLT